MNLDQLRNALKKRGLRVDKDRELTELTDEEIGQISGAACTANNDWIKCEWDKAF